MSPLDILKLVGFSTGAVLHLYIAALIWNRRLGSTQKLTQPERVFMVLGICTGAWFLGNLLTALHGLLLGPDRITGWLRASDTVTITGIALLPSALLHAHIAFWSAVDNYRFLNRRRVSLIGLLLYAPVLGLPYALYLIHSGDYQPFLMKLRPLLITYSAWFLFAFWSSALLDWLMKDRAGQPGASERIFFRRIAALLFIIGLLEFVVVGLRQSGPDDPLWVTYVLLSLLPTFTVAYHVYRYRIVQVVIKDSLVYAAFALVFLAVYTYGVRYIVEFLVDRYGIQPAAIEATLILVMVALAGPLVRVIDQSVQKLFAREIGLYRDVVRQVSAGASGFGELESLVRYTEETIRRGLDLKSVKIIPVTGASTQGPAAPLFEKLSKRDVDVLDADEELEKLSAKVAYALKREGSLVGVMLLAADPDSLTSEKRSVLEVLAGQVAIEIETCRLVEEKVRLERELSNRERLATLGQVAATVAHEVKNPLSSIKSIAQVMREEIAQDKYRRDLDLIVSEIDRLNRTVSQLLAFSRPGTPDPRSIQLDELIHSTVGLLANEANDRRVNLAARVEQSVLLSGAQAAAARQALTNLILNAVQASEPGSEVVIEARSETGVPAGGFRSAGFAATEASTGCIAISVTDQGKGISEEIRSRIFEPFFTTKSRGTGLGLAVVQRRTAELSGTIEVTSPVSNGRGTRFELIFPLLAESQKGDSATFTDLG